MGKKHKRNPTPPWLTGKAYQWSANKAMPPWIKLDATLMQDPTFQSLTPSAQLVYLSMCLEMGSKGGVWFSFPESTAKMYGFPKMTFRRAVEKLEGAGFIRVRKPMEGWKESTFAPKEYQIVTIWKQ